MTGLPIQQAARIVANGIPDGERTNPCACGDAQAAHSGKKGTGKCTVADCICTRYRIDPAWHLAYAAIDASNTSLGHALREYDRRERAAHYNKNPRKEGHWSLGPSDAGTCRRAIWYRNMPPADLVLDPVDGREARMGQIIHTEVERRLRAMYPWREYEKPVQLPGLDRDARPDWYDPITAEIEDLKTAGDWRWDQVDDFGVSMDVWKQVFLYGLAKHRQGYPVRTIRVTYLKRCNGHDQTFVEDFSVELAEQYLNELLVIAQALDIVHDEMQRILAENPDAKYDPGELLPRDRSGPSTDPLCKRCPFRSHCWNLEQAKEAGRSGESYTILGPEPDAENIEWAIRQNVEAKDQFNGWKKAKEETEAVLDGLEVGRYGDVQLVMSQDYGSKPQYAKDSANLRERIARGEVIDPETLGPVPKGDPVRKLQAKRVPKSVLAKEERDRKKALAAATAETAAELAAEVTA